MVFRASMNMIHTCPDHSLVIILTELPHLLYKYQSTTKDRNRMVLLVFGSYLHQIAVVSLSLFKHTPGMHPQIGQTTNFQIFTYALFIITFPVHLNL